MKNADRNFVRITRSSIIVYPPVVKRFGLTPQCSVFVLWGVLGHDWIFFTPAGFSSRHRLLKVNPDSTLYHGCYTAEPYKRGDYEITSIDLITNVAMMQLPADHPLAANWNEMHTIYKLNKISDEKQ